MEQLYEELVDSYMKSIKDYVKENGNIFPHVNVFAKNIESNKTGCIVIPLTNDILDSEEHKEEFIKNMVPQIAKKIKEQFVIHGVAWTSEVWIRKTDVDKKLPDNWKSLPITGEMLLISTQFNNKKELTTFNIIRNGKQVNEEGELVDSIELEESDIKGGEFGGRFSKLYEKFVMD
jgi:hypothetical protein